MLTEFAVDFQAFTDVEVRDILDDILDQACFNSIPLPFILDCTDQWGIF